MSHDHHTPHTTSELAESLHQHDDWFRHSVNEPHHQKAHGETRASVILGFLALTVLFVGVTGYVVLKIFEDLAFREVVASQERRTPTAEVNSLRAQWDEQLSRFGWSDAGTDRVRVPLDVAKRLVMEDYRSGGSQTR